MIRQISCKYESRGKEKSGILYHYDGIAVKEQKTIYSDVKSTDDSLANEGRYYIISNHEGVELEITCDTNSNSCDEDSHKQVEIFAPDLPSNKDINRLTIRSNAEKKLKVYYYSLFQIAPAAMITGEAVDIASIFRYLLLPKLKSADKQLVYNLQYQDCRTCPNILLDVYPDIKYSAEIGFKGTPTDSPESAKFMFHFEATYGSAKREFDYESFNVLDKEAKDNLLYKALKHIGKFLHDTGNLIESLSKEIDGKASPKASDKGIGTSLVKANKWISGSFTIQPMLSLQWSYETSDDLRKLLRHFELSVKAECIGKLKIDLIEVFLRTAISTVTIGTGGVGAILASLIKLLGKNVVSWLINKLKEGLKFDLILIGKVELEALSYDSLRTTTFEGLKVIFKPEIRLELGVEIKTSINFYLIKVSGEGSASVEASASLKWELALNSKDNDLGIDHDMSINPFTIKIGVYILGSFEISKVSQPPVSDTISRKRNLNYSAKQEWSKEWSMKKIQCNINRWVLYKNKD